MQSQREKAWSNALLLSDVVETLILDHHLLRSEEGIRWLAALRQAAAKNRVLCAAEFMGRQPLFLEAWRQQLYEWLPVPKEWHEHYSQGKADFLRYRIEGWDALIKNGKIKPCSWYPCCPIKRFTDEGHLERFWIEHYCLVGNKKCIRAQMEERGEPHPDTLLPDGSVREGLQ